MTHNSVICGEGEEATSHLFFMCRVIGVVWNMCYKWLNELSPTQQSKASFSTV